MGVVAWAVSGVAAGLPASGLVSGTRSHGLPMTSVTGLAGAGRAPLARAPLRPAG
jgi:uncharacterized membrane protein YeaQ/YmgE (transglycosylase-associated protein family)